MRTVRQCGRLPILTDKLVKCGLDKWLVRWTENWLNSWAQRVAISFMKSSRSPVASGVSQWSIMRPILSNIFINNLNDGTECLAVCNFADVIKLGQVVDIHYAVVLLYTWTGWRSGPAGISWCSTKGQAKSCTWREVSPIYQYRLTTDQLQSHFTGKVLGSSWTTSWTWTSNMSLQQRKQIACWTALGRGLITWWEDIKKMEPDYSQYSTRKRGNGAQTAIQEIQFKHKKTLFYYESDWIMEQVAQKCCGISIIADVKNSTGLSPELSALFDTAFSRELD